MAYWLVCECCLANSALRKRKFFRISWVSFQRRLAPNVAGTTMAISKKRIRGVSILPDKFSGKHSLADH